MNKELILQKIVASLTHFFGSIVVVGIILFVFYTLFFPSPLIQLGALQGIKIMLLVDLVLGPVCTFVIFKKGKKTLGFDVLTIIVMQLAALGYGLTMVHSQAPAFLVLHADGIQVVNNMDKKEYMDEMGVVPPEWLFQEKSSYEGKIPLAILAEQIIESDRLNARFNFEVDSLSLFYFNVTQYLALTAENFEVAIERSGLLTEEGCYEINFLSNHGKVGACLFFEGGELKAI